MALDVIQRDFKRKVSANLSVEPQGIDRYQVRTPFILDDGDHPSIILRREGEQWVLSDEGSTFMRLTYEMEESVLRSGSRNAIIENTLRSHRVEDRKGELVLVIPDQRFGDGLYTFVQAILKISDVTFLSKEQVRTTFLGDLRSLVEQTVPSTRVAFNWHHPERDPHGLYPVDFRINERPKPALMFSLPNDDRVQIATIALCKYEQWGLSYEAVGVFEDQERINRKVLARFTDVCSGRQFSTLFGNESKIEKYLVELVSG
jgi:hypothetical protein